MTALLKGIRVVWIGSERGGSTLLEACRREGALTDRQPLIVFAPPENRGSIDQVCVDIHRYSWIVFTSAQAVRAMDGQEQPQARIAAVGPSTRDALHAIHWAVDLLPERNDAMGLVMEFQKIEKPSKPVLFIRGDKAKRTLPEGLQSLGFPLEEVVAYRTREVTLDRAREIADTLAREADVVIAGSPVGVQTLEKAVGKGQLGTLRHNIYWVCLGEATYKVLRQAGIADPVFPEAVTPPAVVAAISCAMKRS